MHKELQNFGDNAVASLQANVSSINSIGLPKYVGYFPSRSFTISIASFLVILPWRIRKDTRSEQRPNPNLRYLNLS